MAWEPEVAGKSWRGERIAIPWPRGKAKPKRAHLFIKELGDRFHALPRGLGFWLRARYLFDDVAMKYADAPEQFTAGYRAALVDLFEWVESEADHELDKRQRADQVGAVLDSLTFSTAADRSQSRY